MKTKNLLFLGGGALLLYYLFKKGSTGKNVNIPKQKTVTITPDITPVIQPQGFNITPPQTTVTTTPDIAPFIQPQGINIPTGIPFTGQPPVLHITTPTGTLLNNLVNNGVEANIALPEGAKRGKTPNTFILRGYIYKFDPNGVIPQRFIGGDDGSGTFIEKWMNITSYPVINFVDRINKTNGLFDLFKLGVERFKGHYTFYGEPMSYYNLRYDGKNPVGQILTKLVWTPEPHLIDTTQFADPGGLLNGGMTQHGKVKPIL